MTDNGTSSSYQKDGVGIHHEPVVEAANAPTGNRKKIIVATVLVLAVGAVGILLSGKRSSSSTVTVKTALANSELSVKDNGSLKLFDKNNRYVFEDYDAKSTFASFLPGVAGYFGKPVWAFYVNRGQGIATFGTESKDFPIMEFNPANKAYQLTPYVGFRTFIRGTRDSESFDIEPFSPAMTRNPDMKGDDPDKPKRIMYVGTNELEVMEIDGAHKITTSVKYFVLPEEEFASLIRRTTIANNGNSLLKIAVLDGLAKMEPYGGKLDGQLKSMGRTLEGWFGVYQAGAPVDNLTMPFYKLSTEPSDEAKVQIELAGHYCLSFIETNETTAELLPIIFDINKVFGRDTALDHPAGLMASSIGEILDNPQYGDAKTSSAFAALKEVTLAPGENITIASVFGKASHIEMVPGIADQVTRPGYIAKKFARARTLIDELTTGVETSTVNPLFNGAVKQMFLDNSLRGGLPTIMGNVNSTANYDEDPAVKVFHSFSRIHGDLERDYNAFKIQPSFFSQGPGNYRDVAQNRRDDVTFNPRVASYDVQMFLSYIQADGYEPLTVESVLYIFSDPNKAQKVADHVVADEQSGKVLGAVLKGGPVRPGQLFDLCDQLNITVKLSREEFVNYVIGEAEDLAMGLFGSGYWADHWDYYLDLIEAYTDIYPDGEEALMYDKELRYFFSTATVQPRSKKYVLTLTFDGKSKHVIQLGSTYFDQEKAAEQEAFRNQNTGLLGIEANWQRVANDGDAFRSTPIAKLFLLSAIKFAMRDAYGMGIEYEGGRPGWLDSMNGLPGMLGSGMPETYELLLLLKYVKKVVDTYGRKVVIPEELNTMITTVNHALKKLKALNVEEPDELPLDVPEPLFKYWDVVASARENYRNDVEYYFSGNTTTLTAVEVSDMVGTWIGEVELGIERAHKFGTQGYHDDGTSGVPASFFSYNVTDWELNGDKDPKGLPLVNAKAMSLKKFPMFLEGPVRYMKTIQDSPEKMEDMYNKVLTSGLRDDKLKMYFLSSSLTGQTYDMGRQVSFAPGWLENQSIWLHMSYKYYLQLIRGKLYEQFFSEMKGGGILPYMKPDVYGRSLMECSSFIASSAFPDASTHGKGFLARLSGSTAEFLSMWKHMFIGPKSFFLDDSGAVVMRLTPALPSWLFEDPESDNDPKFDEDGNHVVSFKLFGAIDVFYHNPGARNLFGESPKSYKVTMADGTVVPVDASIIPTELALEIRKVAGVESIDAYF